jgi:hypothetical protein
MREGIGIQIDIGPDAVCVDLPADARKSRSRLRMEGLESRFDDVQAGQ